jgi:hypothetical protein
MGTTRDGNLSDQADHGCPHMLLFVYSNLKMIIDGIFVCYCDAVLMATTYIILSVGK